MRGDLCSPDDAEWLWAWLRSQPTHGVKFAISTGLEPTEFIADIDGVIHCNEMLWTQIANWAVRKAIGVSRCAWEAMGDN